MTEEVNPALDLVELMIMQGVAERATQNGGLDPAKLLQEKFASIPDSLHAIQARVYCENPSASFAPSPGLLQRVSFPENDWLRIDNWVTTGTNVPPFYDPLACKIIVKGKNRQEAVDRLITALGQCQLWGPPNNVQYLRAIAESETFKVGNALTTYLDNFKFTPRYVANLTLNLNRELILNISKEQSMSLQEAWKRLFRIIPDV